MFASFCEIEEAVRKKERKRLVLAGANDVDVVAAVVAARKKQVIHATLIGNLAIMKQLLCEMNEKEEDYELIECEGESQMANLACQMVREKKADVIMKGLMQTSSFMRAVLDKEKYGFVPEGGMLSQATIMEFEDRLLILTDCAVNISPDYAEKTKILKNAVAFAQKFGIETPKVAVIAPVEMVNPKMQSTIDAAMLSKASERKQLGKCIVDGPLGMDNALSAEAARHKGISSEVAGCADILLLPDLCTGNVLTKALVHIAKGIRSCGVLLGTSVPVVMTSRTDTPENKYFAILTTLL